MVKQFEPVFDTNDLINIDNFNAHIKLMIHNETSKAFNLLTYAPEKSNPEIAKAIKEVSRLKYGREKKAVEEEVARRWQASAVSAEGSPAPEAEVK